jgi:hypothetical protein
MYIPFIWLFIIPSSCFKGPIFKRFQQTESYVILNSNSDLSVDSKPVKKLQRIENIKLDSHYLRDPLENEMKNDEIFVGPDAGLCFLLSTSVSYFNVSNCP